MRELPVTVIEKVGGEADSDTALHGTLCPPAEDFEERTTKTMT